MNSLKMAFLLSLWALPLEQTIVPLVKVNAAHAQKASKLRAPAQSVPCDESQFSIWIRGSESRFRAGKKEFYRTEPEEFPKVITKDSGLFDEILFKGTEVTEADKTQIRIHLKSAGIKGDGAVASFKIKPFADAVGFFKAELIDINAYIQKLYVAGGGVIVIEAIRQQSTASCKIEITVEKGH